MKLIYDIAMPEFYQEINEASGEKKYKIKGIFSTIGEKNRNGRIYPSAIWESEVSNYQKNFSSGSMNTLMEYQHPTRTEVDPMEAIAKIEKLSIQGKYVMGEAVLLNNPKANQIKTLIDNGIKIAVSSRGVGKVNNGIVEDFKLITYDIVTNQSDYNAEMHGIVEGVLESKEFLITESGNIQEVQICTESACHMFDAKDIQEAAKKKFDDLMVALKGSKIVTEGTEQNKANDILKKELSKKSDINEVSGTKDLINRLKKHFDEVGYADSAAKGVVIMLKNISIDDIDTYKNLSGKPIFSEIDIEKEIKLFSKIAELISSSRLGRVL